jgi:hypothetical protein
MVETKETRFILPIAPTYVKHWGVWEAVREIYQNALDASESLNCEVKMEWADDCLTIRTTKGSLSRESLVLGNSTKGQDASQRGKFGEGYKLAMLVLARKKRMCDIYTGGELWRGKIEFDSSFNSQVLAIDVLPYPSDLGVTFHVGVFYSEWLAIQKNIRADNTATILEEAAERGRIYVGGLYVTTLKEFHYGYAFAAGEITLDRDRGMVSGFDVSWETSRLWTYRGGRIATELLEAQAPDVAHVDSHVTRISPIASYALGAFRKLHGHFAVPVTTQEEIERATAAGVKWVLVSQKLKEVLRTVKSWFIPTGKSPLDQLKEFRSKWEYTMNADMKADFDAIVASMEPPKVAR